MRKQTRCTSIRSSGEAGRPSGDDSGSDSVSLTSGSEEGFGSEDRTESDDETSPASLQPMTPDQEAALHERLRQCNLGGEDKERLVQQASAKRDAEKTTEKEKVLTERKALARMKKQSWES